MEVKGPSLQITHIQAEEAGLIKLDPQYLKEIAYVEMEYLKALSDGIFVTWEDIRDQWLEDNPEHSKRWEK